MLSLGAMPLVNDYSLCQQIVTVYHNDGEVVTRTVFQKAYFETRKVGNVNQTGSSETNGFFLLIPDEAQACRVGDKVCEGEGPEVPVKEQQAWWKSLIPTKVDGLVVVRNVDVRRWNGAIVHTEAGG